ncbi:hypothetical protein [Geodermatophilus nigrescens]|uniref:PH domain-containing protein n=1 Tax=Geodermatophilus nigrescens TaxID=1070870 RepID=A0A1M5QSQ0_9ACTN|nr:hypothetical protein [Geodermatophilus nigrescens]SHH16739.1 hypothetical protein SAMN05444351_4159 [Geodermatophilus nigrescens]
MTSTARGVREFRPSLRTWWRTLATPVPVTLVALWVLQVFVNTGDAGPGVALVFLLVTVSLGALVVGARHAAGRVVVTDASVRRHDLLARTRAVPRGDVASALLVPGYRQSGSVPTGLLVLLDRDRRPLLRLDGLRWGREQLREIAVATGAPLDVVDGDLRPADLRWRRLYELPWHERHPLGVLVVVAALLVGGAVLLVRTW